MLVIPAKDSTFQMGSLRLTNNLQTVQFTYDFWMDSTEITQGLYQEVVGENPSSEIGDPLPVNRINWYEAGLFCNARSKREGRDTVYAYASLTRVVGGDGLSHYRMNDFTIDYSKAGYRLPTEAEWEYACRAGTTTDFYWGNDIEGPYSTSRDPDADDYAWHSGNASSMQPVAMKLPNAFGLYDMSGNVFEWCNDWYHHSYPADLQIDPTGPENAPDPSLEYRVYRGGSWSFGGTFCLSSAYRVGLGDPINGGSFRCVIVTE
ncbi:MAG: SUMF1/EgtB/PvdO family nonheme iron enzyme [Chitinivibrionales bacterium]|nr:SUMF1/EgtB/PvdO family nonheme iron enzyme [Chitinivibrionales bacterium]